MLWLVNRWQTINIVSLALWPLSIIYCVIVALRRLAYQTGVLKSISVGLPVIVVGNITVGGTGKTPLVIWLADWLKTQGHRPGIVLRGYGGKSKIWPRQVQAESSAVDVGDEAVLLARRTACPVVAAPDRVAAARELVHHTDCTIIISDDGLQHYRLRRDYEISVVDGQRGYGNGFCLPAGPLREPAGRVKKVNLVVTNGKAEEGTLTMEVKPTAFRNIRSNKQVPLNDFKNKAVHAIAGIGNTARFFDTLRSIGTKTVNHPFPDHYRFSENDLDFGDNLDIIITEKDAVKCTRFAGTNCWVLMVDARPTAAMVEKLRTWVEETRIG
ncbi:MAG: tetraacyldisaccharide 4'-kinase [Acidiferrobacterales bacterium]